MEASVDKVLTNAEKRNFMAALRVEHSKVASMVNLDILEDM
jgi:hypothetical protein